MPNHISNRVQIKSFDDDWKKDNEAFEKLQELMKTDNSLFDFNVLIPYPKHWEDADKAHDEAMKAGIKWSDLPADGYNHGGYEWCIHNWGTKWGAYDIGIDYEEIYFQTAWSTPLPIWQEISKRFPDLQVIVEYADEDRGHNCGKLVFLNGKEIERVDMSARPEAELFARAIIAEQQLAAANQEITDLKESMTKLTVQPTPTPPTESGVSE